MEGEESVPDVQSSPPKSASRESDGSLPKASPDRPAPARLVIKALELENFKSYGGTVRVGPFHKRFSAIVGPNGSGKSNVIDAMLFVFGKRAKQMRLSKISELIHKSNTYPNCTAASVTVYFYEIRDTGDADEEFEVLPGSEISVKRTALKNNTSKYFLNGASSSFTQVTDMLRGKGVDLTNNRFLILQGEVEQIAMMKPKAPTQHEDGLLEYLEDIVGSDKFKDPIGQAITELDAFNEERAHQLNRLKGVESERDALQESKEQAEEYLNKSLELLTHKQNLARAHRRDALDQQKQVSGELEKVKEHLASERKEVASSLEEKVELSAEIKVASEDHQKAALILSEARDQYALLERKDIELRQSLKHLKTKEKKLLSSIERDEAVAQKSIEEVTRALELVSEIQDDMDKTKAELEKAEQELEEEYARVKAATGDLRDQLEERKTELLPFREQVHEKYQAVETATAQLKLLIDKISSPQTELAELEAQIEDMKRQIAEMETSAADASLRKENHQSSVQILRQTLEKTKTKKSELIQQRDELQLSIETMKSSMATASSRGRIVSSLIQACREKKLTGVVGQLSELATVDPKYDFAVGAAAGGPLSNIVVETASEAQACVEYLRKHSLGRATFIILEKIEYLRSKMSAVASGSGTRLYDLLDIPIDQHKIAFYYALKETLVTANLSDARRLAFQPTRRNRVVTLKGELIEPSGAMTGGGGSPRRACLGPNTSDPSDAQSLPKMEVTLSMLEQEIADLNAACADMSSNIASDEVKLESAILNMRKLEMQISSRRKQEAEINSRLPKLRESARKALDPHSCENISAKDLEKMVLKAQSQLQEGKQNASELEAHVSALQQQILDVGGKRLQGAKECQQRLQSQIKSHQKEINKAKAIASTSKSSGEKAQSSASRNEKLREAVSADRENMKAQFNEIEKEAVKVQGEVVIHEATLESTAAVAGKLQRRMNSLESFLSEFRKKEVDIENEIEGLKKGVRNFDKRVNETNTHLQSLEDKKTKLANEAHSARGTEPTDNGRDMMDVDDSSEEFQMELEEQTRLGVTIRLLEETIAKLSPNTEAILEYRKKNDEYETKLGVLDKITMTRDEGRVKLETLRKDRLDLFMSGFTIITSKLKEMYQMITLGGDAELELVDSLDPFSEGIEFSVRPPKKSWKNISNLSGGEKTLSSLALVFALHHFKPTPLYFMDEIDAALDFKNVSIVANYVRDRTKNAQFIIISLRNNMFELADRLVGIYKTNNTTKSVTINPAAFVVDISPIPSQ